MPKYLDLEVSLLGIKPRIWRRFLISSDGTFMDLHNAIQESCGWTNSHLFQFCDAKGRERIAILEPAEQGFWEEDEDLPGAETVKLNSYFIKKRDKSLYTYDFGDDWEHVVELKEIVELPEQFTRRLLGGARAFPPEDCGSIPGYERCCEAVSLSPADMRKLDEYEKEEMESTKEWVGDWMPEDFDLDEVRKHFDC